MSTLTLYMNTFISESSVISILINSPLQKNKTNLTQRKTLLECASTHLPIACNLDLHCHIEQIHSVVLKENFI